MARLGAMLGQGAVYALAALALGVLSDTPAYRHFPDDRAELVLSFSHGGARKGECRTLSPDELAELAPNMRRPDAKVCPRERVPLVTELMLDGAALLGETLPPSGLAGDGPSKIYRRLAVEPGRHRLVVRLRDTGRAEGFDHERAAEVALAPRQRFVVDFRADLGGFIFANEAAAGAPE
jgi:hypothetical protein